MLHHPEPPITRSTWLARRSTVCARINSQQSATPTVSSPGPDPTGVGTSDVERVLPHRREVLVVATDQRAVRCREQERIPHVSVVVAHQRRSTDVDAVLAREI